VQEDPLSRILKQADADLGGPSPLPDDLARRVRLRAARRRSQRVAGGLAVAAAIVLAIGASVMLSRRPALPAFQGGGDRRITHAEPLEPDPRGVRAELARLGAEAEWRAAVARRTEEILAQMRRAESLKRESDSSDPLARLRRQVDQAAFTLVAHADRMCREQNLCRSAVVKYQRVITLFPDTPWAKVARQRLQEIEKKGELS
jgi:hypothetical protein